MLVQPGVTGAVCATVGLTRAAGALFTISTETEIGTRGKLPSAGLPPPEPGEPEDLTLVGRGRDIQLPATPKVLLL